MQISDIIKASPSMARAAIASIHNQAMIWRMCFPDILNWIAIFDRNFSEPSPKKPVVAMRGLFWWAVFTMPPARALLCHIWWNGPKPYKALEYVILHTDTRKRSFTTKWPVRRMVLSASVMQKVSWNAKWPMRIQTFPWHQNGRKRTGCSRGLRVKVG